MPQKPQPSTALPADYKAKLAREWVKVAQWSLLSSRGGRATSANGNAVRVTLRVFAKGCPVHCLREVLQELGSKAPDVNPVFDSVEYPGKWYHKAAVWSRDAQAARGSDATLTIVRDLSDGVVTETNTIEDGCGSVMTVKHVFDADSVEIPADTEHYGEQGYSVKIGGVARDPETQLYNYYVSVTERKTLYISEDGHGSAPSAGLKSGEDAYGYSYDAAWLGLRGEPGDYEDSNGDGVSVWDPAARALGESLAVRSAINPEDCTYDVRGDRRVAKRNVTASSGCRKTLFGENDTTAVQGAIAALGHAPAASAGVVWDYRSELRPDRLWNTTTGKQTEYQVLSAATNSAETVFGSDTVVEDKSRKSEPAPASAGGGTLRTVRLSRTPGDRLDASVTTHIAKAYPNAAVTRRSDVFGTAEETRDRNQAAEPQPVTPGFGISGSTTSQVADHGLRDNSRQVVTETSYPSASGSEKKTRFSATLRSTDRSSSGAPPAATASGGQGVSYQFEVTPGGLKNIVTETDSEVSVDAATVADVVTLFESVRTQTDVHSLATRPAAYASGGVSVESSEELQPLGSKNIRTVTRTEKPVSGASKAAFGDIFSDTVATEDANVSDPGTAGQGCVSPGVLTSRKVTKTPAGLARVSDGRRAFKPVSSSARRTTASLSETVDVVSSRNQSAPPTPQTAFPGTGKPLRTVEYSLTPANQYDTTVTTETPTAAWSDYIEIPGPNGRKTYIFVFRNMQKETLQQAVTALGTVFQVSPNAHPNQFGLWDGSLAAVCGELSLTTSRTPWSHSGTAYRRTGSGQVLALTYTSVAGFNVSDGRSVFDGSPWYEGSYFHADNGSNWYEYFKITAVAPYYGS